MLERGKLAIITILTLAIVASAFAWRYHVKRGDRALVFWGSQAAVLIRHAPEVELFRLAPQEPGPDALSADTFWVGERSFRIDQRTVISQAPGLVHARQALIEDRSYLWGADEDCSGADWTYALQFSDQAGRRVTIALDSACRCALYCEKKTSVSVRPISAGIELFFAEQFSSKETDANAGGPSW